MKRNYLLSFVFGAMLMATPVSADVISLHTAAAVGDNLSIALNSGVKATLTWGDGSTEEVAFNGGESKITVKHADLTISVNGPVTSLYCPDCSLTSLNVSEAPNLVSLICSGNQLSTLNISNSANLVNLQCDGNQLTKIDLAKCEKLENLNVADNKLTSLSLNNLGELKTLICANNELTSLAAFHQKNLETLWCQGNQLKSFSLLSTTHPVQICAFDNQITSLKDSYLTDVEELWLDNNQLKELNLSEAPTKVLSVSNNLLTTITLNKSRNAQRDFEAFYADGNQLFLNSMPTFLNPTSGDSVFSFNIDNQKPFEFVESVNVNENLDLGEIIKTNGWGVAARTQVVWKDALGKELVKGEDYKFSGSAFSFVKPFSSVYAEITSYYYPGIVFKLAGIKVVDPTGIEGLNDNGLRVAVNANGIGVSCSKSAQIKIYNVSGAMVVNEVVEAGSYNWTLPAGLYVVNGKKVVVSR